MKFGHIVLAIPDSGLFVKDGKIVTGHQTEMRWSELSLFENAADAHKVKSRDEREWNGGDVKGHEWHFVVVPVVVKERKEK